jgi:hypothetical protein
VNAGSCGLGFSTAFEQEGGGPIFNIRLQKAPLAIYGLPPKPDPFLSPIINKADQGVTRKIQGDFTSVTDYFTAIQAERYAPP